LKKTRKRYSADFKAKVALEAIPGDLALAELAAKHGIYHMMIAAWKRQAVEGMAGTFSVQVTRPGRLMRPKSRSFTPRSASWSWSGIW